MITLRHEEGIAPTTTKCASCGELMGSHLVATTTIEGDQIEFKSVVRWCIRCASQLRYSIENLLNKVDPISAAGERLMKAKDVVADAVMELHSTGQLAHKYSDGAEVLNEAIGVWKDASNKFVVASAEHMRRRRTDG